MMGIRCCSMLMRTSRLRCWRWCRRRRWRTIVCLCVAGVFFGIMALVSFAYYFRHQLFDTFVRCRDADSRKFIEDFCGLYREGAITGSLCRPLCETGEVQFESCTNFHAGKEVHLMNCSNYCQHHQTVPAVLKSSVVNVTSLLTEHPNVLLPGDLHNDITDMVKHQIQQLVMTELGFLPFAASDAITMMWDEGYDKYLTDPVHKNAAYRTVMLLMDQTEYKVMRALKDTGVVPRIYGTCGPLYLEESCPPGPLDVQLSLFSETAPSRTQLSEPGSWQEKAMTAISLLHLLGRFHHKFPQLLHLCDVKGSNFGVCSGGSVKMIDMDSVFFDTTMYNIFNLTKCKSHGDCNFFDCHGWCDVPSGKCYSTRINNNLQLVCDKVLVGPMPAVFDAGGLLSGAPSSVVSELKTILRQCTAQTSEENGIPVYKPQDEIRQKIISVLQQSITEF